MYRQNNLYYITSETKSTYLCLDGNYDQFGFISLLLENVKIKFVSLEDKSGH